MHTFLTLLITDTLDDPYAFPCSRHPYIISSPPPWSLALPHWRFSPTAPGAVLTTLDLCPLNIDLHLRSPDQIRFARVLVSTTATYHLQLKTFLRLYQIFGNLNQDLCPGAAESENKTGAEPLPHLETLPRIGFGLRSNILWLILTPAFGQRSNSSRLFPDSEVWGAALPESNLGCDLWSISRTFQHRG